MKRALLTLSLLGLAVLVMAARPASDLQLFTQLNGQPVRWVLPDGGQSGLFTQFDAGAANYVTCAALDGGSLNGVAFKPNALMFMPEVPVNICIRPQVDMNGRQMTWDGGCNGTTNDINGGTAWQAFVPFFAVPHPNAAWFCAFSDAGYVRGALSQMQ